MRKDTQFEIANRCIREIREGKNDLAGVIAGFNAQVNAKQMPEDVARKLVTFIQMMVAVK